MSSLYILLSNEITLSGIGTVPLHVMTEQGMFENSGCVKYSIAVTVSCFQYYSVCTKVSVEGQGRTEFKLKGALLEWCHSCIKESCTVYQVASTTLNSHDNVLVITMYCTFMPLDPLKSVHPESSGFILCQFRVN